MRPWRQRWATTATATAAYSEVLVDAVDLATPGHLVRVGCIPVYLLKELTFLTSSLDPSTQFSIHFKQLLKSLIQGIKLLASLRRNRINRMLINLVDLLIYLLNALGNRARIERGRNIHPNILRHKSSKSLGKSSST